MNVVRAQQDAPGPDHRAETRTTAIDGVILQRFPSAAYAHGLLTELHNERWSSMFTEPIEHVYLVSNDESGARQEWYEHRQSTDRYVVLEGSVRVALFDGRSDSTTHGVLEVYDLVRARDGWAGLRIPPGVWHSFRITGERLMLMNAKTPGYQRENPDKFRMPMPNDQVDFSWDDDR